jgi:hypothetical protein
MAETQEPQGTTSPAATELSSHEWTDQMDTAYGGQAQPTGGAKAQADPPTGNPLARWLKNLARGPGDAVNAMAQTATEASVAIRRSRFGSSFMQGTPLVGPALDMATSALSKNVGDDPAKAKQAKDLVVSEPQLDAVYGPKPNDLVGGLLHGTSQFITGALPFGAAGIPTASALSMGTAFDPYEATVADFITAHQKDLDKFPVVGRVLYNVANTLKVENDDTPMEARIKKTIEGEAVGRLTAAVLHPVIRGMATGFARAKALAAGTAEAAQRAEADIARLNQPAPTDVVEVVDNGNGTVRVAPVQELREPLVQNGGRPNGNVQTFNDATNAEFGFAPGEEPIIKSANGEPSVLLKTRNKGGDVVEVELVKNLSGEPGAASEALGRLVTLADEHNVTLTLQASPLEEGLSREKLRDIYRKNGFEQTKAGDANMVRRPGDTSPDFREVENGVSATYSDPAAASSDAATINAVAYENSRMTSMFTPEEARIHNTTATALRQGEVGALENPHFNLQSMGTSHDVNAQITALTEQFSEAFSAAQGRPSVSNEVLHEAAARWASEVHLDNFLPAMAKADAAGRVALSLKAALFNAATKQAGQEMAEIAALIAAKPGDEALMFLARRRLATFLNVSEATANFNTELGRGLQALNARSAATADAIRFGRAPEPVVPAGSAVGRNGAESLTNGTRAPRATGGLQEPHRVNLDRAPRRAPEDLGLEHSPEGPTLEGGTPDEASTLTGQARKRTGEAELAQQRRIQVAEQRAAEPNRVNLDRQPKTPAENLGVEHSPEGPELTGGAAEEATSLNGKAKARSASQELAQNDRLTGKQAPPMDPWTMPEENFRSLLRMFARSGGDIRVVPHVLASIERETANNAAAWAAKGAAGKLESRLVTNFINSLISGFKTMATIATSGAAMNAFEASAKVLAGAGTLNRGLAEEGAAQWYALARYAKENMRGAWGAFKENRSIIDGTPPFHVDPNPIMKGISVPGRVAGALDEFTRVAAYRADEFSAAFRQARDEGLSLADAAKRAELDVRTSVDQATGMGLNPAALKRAGIPTLSDNLGNDTLIGKLSNTLAEYPLTKFAVTFIRPSVNTFRYAWANAPLLNSFNREAQAIFLRGGEEATTLHARTAMTGSMMLYSMSKFMDGEITGSGPKDPQLRAEWSKNHQPYSVKINGTWHSYRRAEPFATFLGSVADGMEIYHEVPEDDRDQMGEKVQAAFGAMVSAGARNITSKSWTESLLNFFSALDDKDGPAAIRYLRGVASGMVPYSAAIRQFNPDPAWREVRTILDGVRAQTPGWSETLPANYDWSGEKRAKQGSMWNRNFAIAPEMASKPQVEDTLVDNYIRLAPPNPRPFKGIDMWDKKWARPDGKVPYEVFMEKLAATGIRKEVEEFVHDPESAFATAPKGNQSYPESLRKDLVSQRVGAAQLRALNEMLDEFSGPGGFAEAYRTAQYTVPAIAKYQGKEAADSVKDLYGIPTGSR